MTQQEKSRYQLTNGLIYAHALILIIPWEQVPYKPVWLGPIDFWISLFIASVVALTVETFRSGRIYKTGPGFGAVVCWFIIINCLGLMTGVLEINPVRLHIPVMRQVAWIAPYADGLLVYYLIKRNQWTIKEFDRFACCLLVPGLLISLECFLVFYLELPLGIRSFSMRMDEEQDFFMSLFCRHTTHPGPIGLMTVGVSLYLGFRKGMKRFVPAILLGAGLVFANTTLLAYLGLLGMACMMVFMYGVRNLEKEHVLGFSAATVTVIFTVMAIVLVWGNSYREDFTSIDLLKEKAHRRSYQILRSLDTLYNYPFLGGGPGLGLYYSFSKYTHPAVTTILEEIVPPKYVGKNWFIEDPYSGKHQSIHSLYATAWADLGVLGLVLVLYVFYWWGCNVVILCRSGRKANGDTVFFMAGTSILGLLFAFGIFISGKPKFYPYWMWAYLMVMAEVLVRQRGLDE